MNRLTSALALALGAGCASTGGADCRGTDWYEIGFRDAIFGMQRQEEVYVSHCERQGVKVDIARYEQGWKEGKYEADYRHPGPIH
jgi:uncharacterized protein DUF2799